MIVDFIRRQFSGPKRTRLQRLALAAGITAAILSAVAAFGSLVVLIGNAFGGGAAAIVLGFCFLTWSTYLILGDNEW